MWRRTTLLSYLRFRNTIDLHFRRSLHQAKDADSSNRGRSLITFVLGGPGSGKGTQCTKIAETFGFLHLSAGELLRKEILSGHENGAMILDIIKEGKIVPSEITVNLLHKEIELSENKKVLIDGFPRTDENRIAFERILGVGPDLVIFFDCPKEEMVKRLLSRNQGRIDDNIETIMKRLEVFDKLNLPVINYYSRKGKVHKISLAISISLMCANSQQLDYKTCLCRFLENLISE